MARVMISLVDEPGGLVAMRVDFEGGYNPDSHAHGQAGLIVAMFDKMADERIEAGEATERSLDELENA